MNELLLRDHDLEQLSAYLDGQLSPVDTQKVEARLAANAEWQQALDELYATRALLRSAPPIRAPRNFTLTPEQAAQAKPKPWWATLTTFRFSTMATGLAILAIAGIQVFSGPLASTLSAPAAALAPAAEMYSAAEEASPKAMANSVRQTASTEAVVPTTPPIILWGNNSGFVTNQQSRGSGGGKDTNSAMADAPVSSALQPDAFTAENFDPALAMPAGEPVTGVGGGPSDIGAVPSAEPASGAVEEPAAALPAQATAAAVVETTPSSSGPILGLPSADEAGQIIATGSVSTGPIAYSATPGFFTASFWTGARISQAALLIVALTAGILAIVSRRRII